MPIYVIMYGWRLLIVVVVLKIQHANILGVTDFHPFTTFIAQLCLVMELKLKYNNDNDNKKNRGNELLRLSCYLNQ